MTKTYHPIDHGYAWAVCAGVGVQMYFVVGGLKSMGIIFISLVEMFNSPPSLTSLTLGLTAGGFAVFAFFSNALGIIIGYRTVVIMGAFLCSFAAFMSMWAMNIAYDIVFLGFCSGLAYGAMGSPSLVILNQYFDKRKSLANGVAMVGSSIGQLSLPYLVTYLMDEFGYRGAMLLYCGIIMQAIPAALLCRTPDFWIPGKKSKNSKPNSTNGALVQTNGIKSVENGVKYENKNLREVKRSQSLDQSRTLSRQKSEELCHSRSSLHHSRSSLKHKDGGRDGLYDSMASLGISMQNLAQQQRDQEEDHALDDATSHKPKRPNFCTLLFDKYLMKSLTMWMLFIGIGVGHAGFICGCLYLPSLAYDLLGSKYKGALLVTIAGAFDIGGRLGGGWFGDLGIVPRTHITGFCMIVTGSVIAITTFHPVYWMLIVCAMTMGLVGGIYRVLSTVVCRDLFGPEKLGAAVALIFMAMGTIILPVPTLLGFMKEWYGNYILAMLLCGVMMVIGGIFMFLLPIFKRIDDRRMPPEKYNASMNVDPENVLVVPDHVDVDNNEVDEDDVKEHMLPADKPRGATDTPEKQCNGGATDTPVKQSNGGATYIPVKQSNSEMTEEDIKDIKL